MAYKKMKYRKVEVDVVGEDGKTAETKIELVEMGDYWRILRFNGSAEHKDAHIGIMLYTDENARLDNPDNVIFQFKLALGNDFFEEVTDEAGDKLIIISMRNLYEAVTANSITEAAKPDYEQNRNLAFFADAESV